MEINAQASSAPSHSALSSAQSHSVAGCFAGTQERLASADRNGSDLCSLMTLLLLPLRSIALFSHCMPVIHSFQPDLRILLSGLLYLISPVQRSSRTVSRHPRRLGAVCQLSSASLSKAPSMLPSQDVTAARVGNPSQPQAPAAWPRGRPGWRGEGRQRWGRGGCPRRPAPHSPRQRFQPRTRGQRGAASPAPSSSWARAGDQSSPAAARR